MIVFAWLEPAFPKDAVILGYRMSRPIKAFTAIACAILAFILGAGFYTGALRDALGVTAILGGLLILQHLQQFGYRVAYDDQAIWVRRWGIFNALNIKSEVTSITWNQVLGFRTSIRQVYGRDSDYEANEFLEIKIAQRTKDRVRIYPYVIDMRDFEKFADVFSAKVGKSIELD